MKKFYITLYIAALSLTALAQTKFDSRSMSQRNASTRANTLEVDLNSLAKGFYLLNINGIQSHRISVN